METKKVKEEKLNLYQKLLVIQQSVVGLGKDKSTKTQYNPSGYAYVTGSKVLEHIKPLMNDLGIILKQEVYACQNQRIDYTTKNGSKSEILTNLSMTFTWVDCESGEKDVNLFGANGQNDWEKGYGSALTYAERYFLLKYFHISTDEDDIDNPDRQTSAPIPLKQPVQIKEDSEANRVATMQGRSNPEFPSGLGQSILNAKTQEDLKVIWESNPELHTEKKFTDAVTARKKEILNK